MPRLDLLIFGATGFTGKYIVEELARKSHQQQKIKWGVAGRSLLKLKEVLDEITKTTDLSAVETVAADVNNTESVTKMCQKTIVLINCVGPYRLYGEPVVQACLNAKTNYIDVSGEPQFLETIQLKYNDKAEKEGVAIVGSCGFDSVIADMGVETIRREYEAKNADIGYIESFLSVKAGLANTALNYATWESAVYGLTYANELKPLRKKLFPQQLLYTKYKRERGPVFPTTFANQKRWCVPFLGSDKSVVQRTQYFNSVKLNKKPCEQSSFQMRFVTRGWKQHLNEEHTTEPDLGSVHEFIGIDPAYIGTSKIVLACALTLREEKDRLPL
ncbi:unnamed protein product, partial [Didymodactylos carnosus]